MLRRAKAFYEFADELVPGIARKKIMYVRFLKLYALIPMIEVEFAMVVAPLFAIG